MGKSSVARVLRLVTHLDSTANGRIATGENAKTGVATRRRLGAADPPFCSSEKRGAKSAHNAEGEIPGREQKEKR